MMASATVMIPRKVLKPFLQEDVIICVVSTVEEEASGF